MTIRPLPVGWKHHDKDNDGEDVWAITAHSEPCPKCGRHCTVMTLTNADPFDTEQRGFAEEAARRTLLAGMEAPHLCKRPDPNAN